MSRPVPSVLKWSSVHHAYEMQDATSDHQYPLEERTESWYRWLETHSSFAFQGRSGHLTLLKEARKRGGGYWYAYKRQGKRTLKRYLGPTSAVTIESLEAIARLLNLEYGPSSDDEARLQDEDARQQESQSATDQREEALLFAVHPPPVASHSFLLLTSKVSMPQLRARHLVRPHLLRRLIQQQQEGGVILLSAPAGSGKTSVFAEWLTAGETVSPQSGQTPRAAWLSLDEADNDPARFLTYLLAALQTLEPNLGHGTLASLHASHPVALQSMLAHLLNALPHALKEPFVLVLDDYHLITSPAIHQALAFLLAHLPEHMCLALATRSEFPVSLARLRAQGRLLELSLSDLRLTGGEIESFLQKALAVRHLDATMVEAIEHHTEGWIAGVQLIGLSLRHAHPSSLALPSLHDSHRFLLDYLLEEVLLRQPEPIQRFLLQTCVFDRLCDSLCVFVLGAEACTLPFPSASDRRSLLEGGSSMLKWLEQANLFLVALDEQRRWYRYHALFADLLRSHLQQTDPQQMRRLCQRASFWHEQQGMIVEAIHYALQASDFERAASLIEQTREDMERQGHFQMVGGWLQALPEEVMQTRPLLCLHHALFSLFCGQAEACAARVRTAEAGIASSTQHHAGQMQRFQGTLLMVRAFMAHFAGQLGESIALARQALQWLSPEDVQYWRLADIVETEYRLTGETTTATTQALEAAIAAASHVGVLTTVFSHTIKLAQVHLLRGHWRQAERTCERIQRLSQEHPENFEPFANLTVTYAWCRSAIAYQRNDLPTAQRVLSESISTLQARALPVSIPLFVNACLLLTLIQEASGQSAQADATLELAAQQGGTASQVRTEALRARLALLRHDPAPALQWAEQHEVAHFVPPVYAQEQEALTLVRVCILPGQSTHQLQEALALLKRLLHEAEQKERFSSVLEMLVLCALAHDRLGERSHALKDLTRALALAAPEGVVRVFVEEGLPLARLLSQLSPGESRMRLFLRQVMAAFPPAMQKALPYGGGLLSAREREIVHFLGQGMTNAHIAQTLVISPSTVKRHVSTIFLKLDVLNRTQAVARARELGLLF